MTYCLAIITTYGLVMAADSRTNAGVDYVSTAQKLFDFSQEGDRVILMCTSGNLSMTQNVLTQIRRDIKNEAPENLYSMPAMYEVAQYLGAKTRQIMDANHEWLRRDGIESSCNFLLGGQIKGEAPELYMIYSQGNFLRATKETPYLQIGEIKYGKPILDRTISYDSTNLDEAAKCALLSIDSTMKSNITVGPPINMVMYEADTFKVAYRRQLRQGDPYLIKLRQSWEKSVKKAFRQLPDLDWEHVSVQIHEDNNWLAPSNVYPT
ncbi:peptidase [Synechococcales cyanobacterium C]|uniref:Peptidase n=1 Tax=Petrachloros mirabilis ULC683 TaxID=2781853 RepID=A0A8K1ZXR1_9CYAN|nr:proteasome-type protease [Petrachloros mirabilis]NCJ07124.1 peptidase [Petrachloros mirabilis ULC683]